MDVVLDYKESKIKQKKRNEILDRSMNIFIREGLYLVKMKDIAKVCDISLRSLYYYYSNKDDLAIDIQIKLMSKLNHLLKEIKLEGQVDYNLFCAYLDNMYKIIMNNQKEIKYITAFDYYFFNSYPNKKYTLFLKSLLSNDYVFSKNVSIKLETFDLQGSNTNDFFITIIQSFLAYAQKIIYREKAMLSENIHSRGELSIYLDILKKAIKA